MTSLFIIESPFQLLSAIEAKKELRITEAVLILRYSMVAKTNAQINKLLKISQWETVFEIKSTFSIFDSNVKLFLRLLNIQGTRFDNIFIGEYRSWVLRSFFYNLYADNTYLLDDGAASLTVYRKYIKENKQPDIPSSRLDSILLLLYRLKGLHTHGKINLLFFTTFDIPEKNSVKNDFSFVKKMMSKQTILKDTTYFFGAPLSEEKIVPEETELAYLKQIFYEHVERERRFVYIPHRRESERKICKIKKLRNISVSAFDFPAEMEFVFRKEQPDAIASFYSSVLQTLPAIYCFKKVVAYEIPLQFISKKHQDAINAIYEEYRKKITIVPLGSF